MEEMVLDYEQYFVEAQAYFKELKSSTDAQSKNVKKIQKCILDGDINALPKLFATLRETAQGREAAISRLESLTEGFDGHEYMSCGDYTSQMIDCCRQLGVDVQGNFPVYDMFPCRVTVNPDAQEVTIDRKRFACLRPSKLVSIIKAELDVLAKANFNAQNFAKELAAVYDLAIIRTSKKKPCSADAPIYALELYDLLTPMKRHKKDYTKNDYAYDLARLYSADSIRLDDGRTLRFDTARDMKKAIRILDNFSSEQYITTVRYIKF
jgi:hypothetical protein